MVSQPNRASFNKRMAAVVRKSNPALSKKKSATKKKAAKPVAPVVADSSRVSMASRVVKACSFAAGSIGSLGLKASSYMLSGGPGFKKPNHSEKNVYKFKKAKAKFNNSLKEVAMAEHALNLAKIKMEDRQSKLAERNEELNGTNPSMSVYSRVTTAAVYLGAASFMVCNPEVPTALAGAAYNTAGVAFSAATFCTPYAQRAFMAAGRYAMSSLF